jgi:hypothetical protein
MVEEEKSGSYLKEREGIREVISLSVTHLSLPLGI